MPENINIDGLRNRPPAVDNAQMSTPDTSGNSIEVDRQLFHQLSQPGALTNSKADQFLQLYDQTGSEAIQSKILHHLSTQEALGNHLAKVISLLGKSVLSVTQQTSSSFIYSLIALVDQAVGLVKDRPAESKDLSQVLVSARTAPNDFLSTVASQQLARLGEEFYVVQSEVVPQGDEALAMTQEYVTDSARGVLKAEAVQPTQPLRRPSESSSLSFEKGVQSREVPIQTDDGSIKVVNSSNQQTVIDINAAGAWASALGGPKQGIVAFVADVGAGPMIGISPPVEFLIDKLSRLRRRHNIFSLVIVSDGVACLKNYEASDYVKLVPEDSHSVDDFSEMYKALLDEAYRKIVSIHLSPSLSDSYELAKEAAAGIKESEIKVVNSHANGVGLGLIIREVDHAITHHYSPEDVDHLIDDCIRDFEHWVVPLAFNYLKNRKWLDRVADKRDKVKLRMFNYKPIITVKDKIHLEKSYYNKEQAIKGMLEMMMGVYKKRRKRVRRIGVEYKGLYRTALDLRNRIKVLCPNVDVTVHVTGSNTAAHFGPEMVGICLI
ncbi:hypothetical protein DID77_01695 [Candidatus Marinamargulisbacteria bacterium SCGC AG-439-L15]|nr:hypothetical protein DID77_01695 [Candidatus Marinamargulisbacteria bacterium SCGC AG-439-L15]